MKFNLTDSFINFVHWLYSREQKEFQKILLIAVGSCFVIAAGMVYFIESQSSDLLKEITQLQASQKKTRRLLINVAEIEREEERFQTLMSQNKNFSMKSFFELFCKEQRLTPASGGETTVQQITPQVEEVSLVASFKGLTTQRLVEILQELDKNELVSVKKLRVKADKDRRISVELTLASIRNKQGEG